MSNDFLSQPDLFEVSPELVYRIPEELSRWAQSNDIPASALGRISDMLAVFCNRGNRYRHEMQRPPFYMPELTARPWHDPDQFDWVPGLEAATGAIISEYRRVTAMPELWEPESPDQVEGTWNVLNFFIYGDRRERVCRLMPDTTRAIERIPTATEACLVFLSALAPKTRIFPHYATTNCRIRCHFGVDVPEEGCFLRVGDESRSVKTGKCVIFDDSFVHHAENARELTRVVLIIDFWHPELTPVECRALEFLTKFGRAAIPEVSYQGNRT